MNKRSAEYEFIRTVAMLFVIGVHVIGTMPTNTGVRVFYGHFFSLIFYTCNCIFFMLSGKFALGVHCESREEYQSYYIKKLKNLILPVFVYLLLRSVYDAGGIFWTSEFWSQFFSNLFSDYNATEYWFLYKLIGLVLAAPFLAKLFERLKKEEMAIFLLLAVVYNAMKSYLPYLNLRMDWSYPFGSWTFYFCLGYCLEKIVSGEKEENRMILCGILAFLISMVLKYCGIEEGIHDMAPTSVVMVSGFFVLLKRIYPLFEKMKLEKFFLWSGKHSMAVYMLHMEILMWIKASAPLNHYLPHLFLVIFFTAAISLVLGMLIDETIIRGLKTLVSPKKK